MRRSQHTESEILHLLREANEGVPVGEICRTARVSLRTFYRWRRRFGGLTAPAVVQMRELEAENRRLRALVSNLAERAKTSPPPPAGEGAPAAKPGAARSLPSEAGSLHAARASVLAAERCGGALVGRFASVRVSR